jgi:hypothetical protein
LTLLAPQAITQQPVNVTTNHELTLSGGVLSGNGCFSFHISGTPKTDWNEYESSDLMNWKLVGEVALGSSGTGWFADTNVTSEAHRFYKLSDGTYCSQPIGFARVTVGPGTGTNALIANQLDAPVNTLDGLFNLGPNHTMPDGSSLPPGSEIMKWNGSSSYDVYTWNGTDWGGNGGVTLAPGEGAFLVIPTNNPPVTVTFVGLVREGQLAIPLAAGYSMVSSMLPEAGGIQSVLGYQPYKQDQVLFWNGNGFSLSTCTILNGNLRWSAGEPVLNVGQAVFMNTRTNEIWRVNYSPGQ